MLREMTEEERKLLGNLLIHSPSSFKRLKQGVENGLVVWASTLLLIVLIWLLLSWLIKVGIGTDFGIRSQYSIWIVTVSAFLCGVYAIYSTTKWVRNWPDPREAIWNDINEGNVVEERYSVSEVQRFQEPEHGGLIYFLKVEGDRVLVLYDYESVELEMSDDDALSSTFKPCRKLRIVRGPNTGYVITREFSGDIIPLSEPKIISVPPSQWPEPDTWCKIPWEALENRLST